MPDGLPEFLLIVGVIVAVGVAAVLVCGWLTRGDQACVHQVVESTHTGVLHDAAEWELQLLPGFTGPWPCPYLQPCPIHDEGRSTQ